MGPPHKNNCRITPTKLYPSLLILRNNMFRSSCFSVFREASSRGPSSADGSASSSASTCGTWSPCIHRYRCFSSATARALTGFSIVLVEISECYSMNQQGREASPARARRVKLWRVSWPWERELVGIILCTLLQCLPHQRALKEVVVALS